jgi:hypothetical protein
VSNPKSRFRSEQQRHPHVCGAWNDPRKVPTEVRSRVAQALVVALHHGVLFTLVFVAEG